MNVIDRTRINYIVDDMNPCVVSLLFKLIRLKLIKFEFYETDDHQISVKYWFTNLGKLIGLLPSYKSGNTNIYKDLYYALLDYYDGINNSYAKFFSIYIKKSFKDQKIFDKLIDCLFNLLESAGRDKDSFLNKIQKIVPLLTKKHVIYGENLFLN